MTRSSELPSALVAAVDEQARAENFPVALRVLPRRERVALAAVYRYARLVDDLGDRAVGDRLALLDTVEAAVRELFATGTCGLPALQPLVPVVPRHALPIEPFLDLIRANRADQRVTSYASWAELAAYCALSAAPVGRLVLAVFDSVTPARLEQSDAVCAGLQLVEHLQDVGEDARAGRVYLPADTMLACGVTQDHLLAVTTSPALRAAVLAECQRARELLAASRPLVGSLRGWARVAVAAYAGGGLAALAAIEAAGGDVCSTLRTPSKRRTLLEAARLWTRP